MTNKQGVILVNLGTPAEATPAGVKAFLQEFFKTIQSRLNKLLFIFG